MRQQQAELFLYFVALGAGGSLVYDMLRALRRELRHPNWLVLAEDSVFWTALLAGCYGLFFVKNQGALRGYGFLGIVCGSILYFLVLSPAVLRLMRAVLKVLFYPVKKVLTKAKRRSKIKKEKAAKTAQPSGKKGAKRWQKRKKKKP